MAMDCKPQPRTGAPPQLSAASPARHPPSRATIGCILPHNMKFGVIVFPGSNCDHDAAYAVAHDLGQTAVFVWHSSTTLGGVDAVILPGGFAYGDYLRCGAIARFSPIIKAVISDARAGKLVLGTCNGFQVLCEAGLLPGALVRNRSLRFVCDMVNTRVEVDDSLFTHGCQKGTLLRLPIAH